MALQRRGYSVGVTLTAPPVVFRFYLLLLLFFFFFFFSLPTSAAPSWNLHRRENVTIEVPDGSRYLADRKLVCYPSTWKSITTFFLVNYVAHAFTVRSQPGQTTLSGFIYAAFAFFLPMSGMATGMDAICRHAILSSRPLDAASKSRALCVVVRTASWRAQDGDIVKGVQPRPCITLPKDQSEQRMQDQPEGMGENRPLEAQVEEGATIPVSNSKTAGQDDSTLTVGVEDVLPPHLVHFLPAKSVWSMRNRKIHGACCLPPGYALTMLPTNTSVQPLSHHRPGQRPDDTKNADLRNSKRERFCLPKTYTLVRLYGSADVNPMGYVSNEISASYSLSKGLVAIVQTVFATVTLFETRGDQMERYGYAAFGLTVTPYLVMSFINLLGMVFMPEYPAVYLVKNDVLDEAAKRQGGHFEGMVAQLADNHDEGTVALCFKLEGSGRTSVCLLSDFGSDDASWVPVDRYETMRQIRPDTMPENPPTYIIPTKPAMGQRSSTGYDHTKKTGLYSLLVVSVMIAIIAGLSQFDAGHSTVAQRVWTMAWLSFGIVYGIVRYATGVVSLSEDDLLRSTPLATTLFLPLFVPAIGGFVVVGQMLKSYGTCKELH